MKGKWCYAAFAACMAIWLSQSFRWLGLFITIVFFVYLYRRESVKAMLTMLLVFILFFGYTPIYQQLHSTTITSEMNNLTGEISTIPEFNGDTVRFRLNGNEHVLVHYKLASKQERDTLKALKVGSTCKLTGKFEAPGEARNFGAFDYKDYLNAQNVYWVFKPDVIRIEQCTPAKYRWSQPAIWRQSGLEYIGEHFPQPAEGITKALVFGWRADLEADVEKLFQQFGIIHLLAISGLHVGFMTAVLFYLLLRIGLTREKTYVLLFCLLPLYMLVAGAAPSVVRAGMMTMCVLFTLRFKAHFLPIDGISLVALCMLIYRPAYLFEAGFQLSFIVSAALILSSVAIFSRTSSTWKQMLYVTVIAQLSALPVMLHHFYGFSLLSIPLNLLFVPFMSLIIMPLSFIAFFLHFVFPPLSDVLIWFENGLLQISYVFLKCFERIDWLTLTFGRPPMWWNMLYSVACIFFFAAWEEYDNVRAFTVSFSRVVLALIFLWCLPYLNPWGEVTVLDVGQGDCIYIELPYRRSNMLIDTGGLVSFGEEKWKQTDNPFQIGKDVVVPFLKANGVRRVERFVLTHGDYDHIGDAEDILQAMRVKTLMIGSGADYSSDWQKDVLQTALKRKTNVVRVKSGQGWHEGKTSFYVLSPFGSEVEKNNRSVVLWAQLGKKKWLFTGDLEEEGEQRLLRTFPALQADLLKAGHHGSKTSSSEVFIQEIGAQVAVISAGKDNRYGHPHAEVLKRFSANKVAVLRTDQFGAIQWNFSQNRGTFRTVLPYDTVEIR
ncbi:DNA internalization-related competence protein ComEC/Rec2 [Bacillus tianshenii]|nr:DNA internalization-related competence protein ComEC/Rec2 [Bacillus tianshenii]